MTTRPEIRRYPIEIDGKVYGLEHVSRTQVEVYFDKRLLGSVSLPTTYYDMPMPEICADRQGHLKANMRKTLKLHGANGNGHNGNGNGRRY